MSSNTYQMSRNGERFNTTSAVVTYLNLVGVTAFIVYMFLI